MDDGSKVIKYTAPEAVAVQLEMLAKAVRSGAVTRLNAHWTGEPDAVLEGEFSADISKAFGVEDAPEDEATEDQVIYDETN